MKTELKQRMNKVSACSLDGNVVMDMAEWNAIVNLVSNMLSQEAEPVGSQDVEEFIAAKKYYTTIANPEEMDGTESVSVSELREFFASWMAGHARVPVEPTHAMKCEGEHVGEVSYGMSGIIYKAMITASKEPHNE